MYAKLTALSRTHILPNVCCNARDSIDVEINSSVQNTTDQPELGLTPMASQVQLVKEAPL
jgi:hypothetical protein